MKIAVIDLEMNKPSDKIIQIGAVALDVKSGEITEGMDAFNVFVNPDEPLDPYIINLTGITENIIANNSMSLNKALTQFWVWMKDSGCGRNMAAWGNDYWLVINQSKDLSINMPKAPRCLNIKEMGAILRCSFPNAKTKGGLLNTMELFGLNFIGRQHDAYWDSVNTARLLSLFQKLVEKSLKVKAILQ